MSLFFVGGSQRSGTTLLQTILCQHSSVNPLIREAKYFRHLVNAYAFGQQAFDHETRFYFKDESAYDDFNANIFKQFITQTEALFPSTEHLVLREPHLTMMFPALARLLKDAKFICIVRNPLDVIASMMVVGEKLTKKGIKDDMSELFNSADMAALSQHFLSFYEPLIQSKDVLSKHNLLFVQYEQLVQQADSVFKQIAEFTGIDLTQIDQHKDLDTGEIEYSKVTNYSQAWRSPLYDQAISNSRINAYKDVLSDSQMKLIRQHCESFMSQFSYQ